MLTFHWSGYHQKREPTESAKHKMVLFSFLQEDKNKNLVVDFIQMGGLAQRVILGKEDEVQGAASELALRGRHAGRVAAHSGN